MDPRDRKNPAPPAGPGARSRRSLYFALSQANQAILRTRQEPDLLRKICDIAAEFGEFPLVWIGFMEPGSFDLRVAARSGPAAAYLDEVRVSTDPGSPYGTGPAGIALRSGTPVVSNRLGADPAMRPWREPALRHGIQACAAFPFRRGGAVAGGLMVYGLRAHGFDPECVALLGEIAEGLAFALEALDADAARRAAEEKYARIFQLCPDAIDLTQLEDGVCCEHNESFTRLYGHDREELLGRSTLPGELGIWLCREDRDRHIALLKEHGTVRDFEAVQRRKDGSRIHVSVSSTLLEIAGRRYNLSISRDITESKRREQELRQAQKMESLGTLAGGVAHDMNNVLGAILALASSNLALQPGDGPAWQAFETIARAARRGGDMVRRLLTFSRQTSHGASPLDLGALCRDVVALLERTTLASVRLQLDLASGLGPVRGDAAALGNALANLCINAVDAMEQGGTLTLRTAPEPDGGVRLEVHDTGSGMSRQVLERALDPFFTTKEAGRGTGLGLSLVYATVQAHGGRMEIQSDPGRGTCVMLRFPACAPAAEPAGPGPEAAPEVNGPAHPAGRLEVLVVDDDELMQAGLQVMLGVLGHQGHLAADGEQALALLEGGLQPDVAILDMNMPGLGGRGTLPRMRALRPALPVLLTTGRADQAALDLLASDPRTSLMGKPFSLQELRTRLETLPGREGDAPAGHQP